MPTEKPHKRAPPGGRVLGRIQPEDFIGRRDALQQITGLAPHSAGHRWLLLLTAPSAGASELLRQAYDELFNQRGGVSPIYFAWTRSDHSTVNAARRFLHTFLVQLVAHHRGDALLLGAPPPLPALMELVAPSDYEWIERLFETFKRAREEGDERALIRLSLSAPQQAAARGVRTLVLFDDVHLAECLEGEVSLGAEIARAALQAESPFVMSGLRRRLLDVVHGTQEMTARFDQMETLHLELLSDHEARRLIDQLAFSKGISINDETRDLLVQQFAGNPVFITAYMQAAHDAGRALTSFLECQKLYVDELLGGRINRRFNALLEEIAPAPATRRALVRVLDEFAATTGGKSPAEVWRRRLNLDADELQRVMTGLHVYELASLNATFVEIGPDMVWRDHLHASYRLQVAAEPRALVVAGMLIETLKRAPQTMARYYRRAAALKPRDLLTRFNAQRVPSSLFHHDRFVRMYRGITTDEVISGLDTETDLIRLPQIVHAASCAAFHAPMQLLCDEERCAVAHGFDAVPYTDASEVVWLAVEIDATHEAGRALVEIWCDRLTQVGLAYGFGRVRLWLISPEGFSAEASELLNEREAFGSNRQQAELLTARLGPGGIAGSVSVALDEFEMVIPMGGDTELIAAHTVEQIARRLNFQPEAINQIKTAVVEACINAAEHSLSPDRKIYQRFRVESDKLVVTVSSRGLALSPAALQNGESPGGQGSNGNETHGGTKGRRGWGLKLIRTLMDDVEFERVDDGTRLRMTKYLRK